jgi:hypothetical protein
MAQKKSKLGSTARAVAGALTAAAIVQELRLPREERTWHGTVAGFVPYDFRFPTPSRLRDSFWNPDDDHLLMAQPFGVGWVVNVGRVVKLLRD